MVSLDVVKASNATLREKLQPGLVAVFVGGTSGIGEITLKLLAQRTIEPRIYIIGRSSTAAERIIADCKALNPNGEYIFIKKDLSLLKAARELCTEIKSREKHINLLFLTVGLPDMSLESESSRRPCLSCGMLIKKRLETPDGLRPIFASHVFARHFIAQDLLPLIQSASGLKRIVDVAGGGHEAEIDVNDLEAERCGRSLLRGRLTTTKTLAWQSLAESAPEVSIVTEFPGLVVTPIFNRIDGLLGLLFRLYTTLFGWLFAVPLAESAERHVFMATSAFFPPKTGDFNGVPRINEVDPHRGVDSQLGSGVYSVGWNNEGPGDNILALLKTYAQDGTREVVWSWIQQHFQRILGHQVDE
jgi:NAD(P)-dependent dehydrogenase (short-subunit alcohol dehydrogenase family)